MSTDARTYRTSQDPVESIPLTDPPPGGNVIHLYRVEPHSGLWYWIQEGTQLIVAMTPMTLPERIRMSFRWQHNERVAIAFAVGAVFGLLVATFLSTH